MWEHNPFDHDRLRSQRIGQGVRARRCSLDSGRRGWYEWSRMMRLARHLGRVVEVSCVAYAMSRGLRGGG